MKYLAIFCALFLILSCVFVSPAEGIFGGSSKKKSESAGVCSIYKGQCGGTLTSTCCKAPYKCGKSTSVCGKDKLCCLTEADIQRHKQESSSWLKNRNGK